MRAVALDKEDEKIQNLMSLSPTTRNFSEGNLPEARTIVHMRRLLERKHVAGVANDRGYPQSPQEILETDVLELRIALNKVGGSGRAKDSSAADGTTPIIKFDSIAFIGGLREELHSCSCR